MLFQRLRVFPRSSIKLNRAAIVPQPHVGMRWFPYCAMDRVVRAMCDRHSWKIGGDGACIGPRIQVKGRIAWQDHSDRARSAYERIGAMRIDGLMVIDRASVRHETGGSTEDALVYHDRATLASRQ